MYARCSVVQGDPELVDQSVKLIREHVLPAAREVAGFAGILSFVDPASGAGMSFTLWESEQARRDSVAWADKVRSDVMAELQGSVVSVADYELVVDER